MVSGLKTFTNKGCKITEKIRKEKMDEYCLTEQDLLVLVFLTPFSGLLPPFPKVQCANFLDFQNPWGKVMERSSLRLEKMYS